MKTFCIKTLGCKVNQCDSEEIREAFLRFGWQERFRNNDVDVCVVNTCCVTHNADRKSRVAIRDAVRSHPRAQVVVMGCYASYDKELLCSINGVDEVFGHNEKNRLFEWIVGASCQNIKNGAPETFTAFFSGHARAFLKIQEGCDNRCSYCVVPLVRGSSRSKSIALVLDQARALVNRGHQEIVLTGVCLGFYGKDLTPRADLVDLISKLEDIDGLARIRLSSIEAADVSESLIDKMAESQKLCPHLHIPFQSGDDEVLRAMNKRLAAKNYKTIVARAREKVKDLAITCDVIVGFPCEKEENFKKTMDFLKSIVPLKTHIFTFSQRRGVLCGKDTASPDAVVVKRRYGQLKKIAQELSSDYKSSYLGKDLPVLFEYKRDGVWYGHSGNYIKVAVKSPEGFLRNKVRIVRVSEIFEDFVKGRILLDK